MRWMRSYSKCRINLFFPFPVLLAVTWQYLANTNLYSQYICEMRGWLFLFCSYRTHTCRCILEAFSRCLSGYSNHLASLSGHVIMFIA